MNIVFLNGKFLAENEAFIPVNDQGFLFGDGVFTTMLVNEGKPKSLGIHLKRIELQCRALNIVPPDITSQSIMELLARNGARSGVWRLKIIVTGRQADFDNLKERAHAHVLMTLKLSKVVLFAPCILCLYPQPVSRPTAKLKTLSYLDRLWIKRYARDLGYFDALVMDPQGYILETGFSNVFWWYEEALYMPNPSLPFLMGTAIKTIEENAKRQGMMIHYTEAKYEDIPKEAQIFICNALSGPCPVIEIEGQNFTRDIHFESKLNTLWSDEEKSD